MIIRTVLLALVVALGCGAPRLVILEDAGAPGKILLIAVEECAFTLSKRRRCLDDETAVPDLGVFAWHEEIGRHKQPDRFCGVDREHAATPGPLSQGDVLRRPTKCTKFG